MDNSVLERQADYSLCAMINVQSGVGDVGEVGNDRVVERVPQQADYVRTTAVNDHVNSEQTLNHQPRSYYAHARGGILEQCDPSVCLSRGAAA